MSTNVRFVVYPPSPGHRRDLLEPLRKGDLSWRSFTRAGAGVDISKKDAKVCVRIQGRSGRSTTSTVTTWGSMTGQILGLKEHLLDEHVDLVVMEATGDYWREVSDCLCRRDVVAH